MLTRIIGYSPNSGLSWRRPMAPDLVLVSADMAGQAAHYAVARENSVHIQL